MKSLTYDEVEEEAGHDGHRMLNWVALSGDMNAEEAELCL
jgi:2,3-dihydroxyphenylpropionate 1,2-dioxygenase